MEFYKMSGHGNDFVLMDNRDLTISPEKMPDIVRSVCRRRLGVGADGMVFIENMENGPDDVDFMWRFFNSDGSEAEMCGNAGRCTAWFACEKNITGPKMSFLTTAGVIRAEVDGKIAKIQMTPPGIPSMDVPLAYDGGEVLVSSINTGVPHAVVFVDDLEEADITGMGRIMRYHDHFAPAGTNANFIRVLGNDRLAIRTYERGVEDETLACGTGAIAAVLLSHIKGLVQSPTRVLTRGGEDLLVHFQIRDDRFVEVYLEGAVRLVYIGRFGPEALI